MSRPLSLLHAARLAAVALMIPYAIARLGTAEYWDLLDDVDLAVHEAGHLIFGALGDHMSFLGGSLFQVIVPAAFVAYFWRSRQRFASGVTLAWVAVNLVNVSRYIGDARAQELPLLGGENAIHDWWYLLTEWDLLSRDLAIARAVHFLGTLAFVLSGVLAWFAAQTQADEMRTEVLPHARSSTPLDTDIR